MSKSLDAYNSMLAALENLIERGIITEAEGDCYDEILDAIEKGRDNKPPHPGVTVDALRTLMQELRRWGNDYDEDVIKALDKGRETITKLR